MHAIGILLERCRRFWERSFDRLDSYLVKMQAKDRQQSLSPSAPRRKR